MLCPVVYVLPVTAAVRRSGVEWWPQTHSHQPSRDPRTAQEGEISPRFRLSHNLPGTSCTPNAPVTALSQRYLDFQPEFLGDSLMGKRLPHRMICPDQHPEVTKAPRRRAPYHSDPRGAGRSWKGAPCHPSRPLAVPSLRLSRGGGCRSRAGGEKKEITASVQSDRIPAGLPGLWPQVQGDRAPFRL